MGRLSVRTVFGQVDLTENDVDNAIEDVVLVGRMVVQRHRLDPSSCASLCMLSDPTPFRSARATAACSTRCERTTIETTVREATMQAIVQDTYGSPDVLELKDIDKPVVGDDQVLVRVHAAGVDPGVWHLMTGMPYLVRLMGYGLRTPKHRVRGTDVAGRVEAVGKNVTRFKPADEVFGTCDGSFAEYACADEAKVASKPVNLTFEQAAAVPVSALTALQGLRDKGQVQAWHKVLIIGAGGGVGTLAVQIAKAFGGACHRRVLHDEGGPGPIDWRGRGHRLHP
jgi:NADPH-dependent curcumin reductase CurA